MTSSHPSYPPWRADVYARRRPYLLARSHIVRALRSTFHKAKFLEVETPSLQVSPGLEPHLDSFATTLIMADNRRVPRYLHSSPEFSMKKLIAAGEKRIYRLGPVFRNREFSTLHHPEFTLLEWYEAGATLKAVMKRACRLLGTAAHACGMDSMIHGDSVCDPFAPPVHLTMKEAFQRWADLNLDDVLDSQGYGLTDVMATALAARGLRVPARARFEDLFFTLFLEKIEPRLGYPAPTCLWDYPAEMAVLARLKSNDQRFAERCELYVAGVELANGFAELTDPHEQRRRFIADQKLAKQLYGRTRPLDEDFLAALAHMPPTSGIALGLDRLVMLAVGAPTIEDVLWLPVSWPREREGC